MNKQEISDQMGHIYSLANTLMADESCCMSTSHENAQWLPNINPVTVAESGKKLVQSSFISYYSIYVYLQHFEKITAF